MRHVALTGVESPLGVAVARLLGADPAVERVTGVGYSLPQHHVPKLEVRLADPTAANLKVAFHAAGAVAHLALASPTRGERPEVVVAMARRVLDAASAAGVGHVVLVSSALVYGAWPSNAVPLTEEAPVRPNPGFAPATARAEVERVAAEWQHDHPGSTVTVLRPAVLVGEPGEDAWLRDVLERPPVRVREAPPAQRLHRDDLAAAVVVALLQRLDGPHNVAPDGWMTGETARALAFGWRPALAEGAARRLTRVGFAVGIGATPPAVLPWTVHPWVVANDRLRAAGWEPEHTSEEAQVLSRRPSALSELWRRRRQEVSLAGAVGALGGAIAVVTALLRRRRR